MGKTQIMLRRLLTSPYPKQIRFSDLERVLLFVGFTLHSKRGSHYNFKHPKLHYILTIVSHHQGNDVLPIYIINTARAIEDLIERGYLNEKL